MRVRTLPWLVAGSALVIVLLVAVVTFEAGATSRPATAAAQPTGQPRSPAGVTVNATLTVSDPTLAPISLRGQVNLNGDLMLTAGSARRPNAAAFRKVGDQGYIAQPPAIWLTSPLAGVIGQPSPCPAASGGIARLLANPVESLGGTTVLQRGGPDTVGGVPVQRYDGNVSLATLTDALTTFAGVSGACGEALTWLALLSAANLALQGPVQTSVWVGDADGLPYRVRFQASGGGRTFDLDARLTPSATPFDISTPAFSESRRFDLFGPLERPRR